MNNRLKITFQNCILEDPNDYSDTFNNVIATSDNLTDKQATDYPLFNIQYREYDKRYLVYYHKEDNTPVDPFINMLFCLVNDRDKITGDRLVVANAIKDAYLCSFTTEYTIDLHYDNSVRLSSDIIDKLSSTTIKEWYKEKYPFDYSNLESILENATLLDALSLINNNEKLNALYHLLFKGVRISRTLVNRLFRELSNITGLLENVLKDILYGYSDYYFTNEKGVRI